MFAMYISVNQKYVENQDVFCLKLMSLGSILINQVYVVTALRSWIGFGQKCPNVLLNISAGFHPYQC